MIVCTVFYSERIIPVMLLQVENQLSGILLNLLKSKVAKINYEHILVALYILKVSFWHFNFFLPYHITWIQYWDHLCGSQRWMSVTQFVACCLYSTWTVNSTVCKTVRWRILRGKQGTEEASPLTLWLPHGERLA